ncbi:hypothetical protein MF271_19485 (plasmid) [Deinococcus sp. KNUC1210]|uniref:hypothetical protein n=1 Tax=Deinococcus sp. KNUC1210 TaxID=2917691 RepID=UPI001EF12AC2|nr:hypothetical protein [Deinococcus sp. KNUC1210]ULH17375.1 hypothetical protein MF271_19485 [Deinococcus sp. KNUC1210]
MLMYKAGVRPTGSDLILNNNHFAMLRVLVRAGWLCKTGRAAQSMYALTPQGLDVRSKLPPPVRTVPQAICRLCGGVHHHWAGCLLDRPRRSTTTR